MNRIIISNGSFTSLLINVILQNKISTQDKNYFLGYFKRIPSEDIKTHQQIANYNNIYSKLLDFDTYKTKFKKINKQLLLKDISDNIGEIYIPINSTTYNWYKNFKRIYPLSHIVLYEEGMLSYVIPFFNKKIRKIMKYTTNYFMLYTPNIENYFAKKLPNIKISKINKQDIIETINASKNKIKLNYTLKKSNPSVLFLPQYYFSNQKAKLSEMLLLLKNNLKFLIERNFNILVKDHPKTSMSLQKMIEKTDTFDKKIYDKLQFLKDTSYFPVEFIINEIDPTAIFSVYSTSLFTLKYLFNYQTYSSDIMLEQRISYASIYPTLTCLLVQNTIEDIVQKKPKNNTDIFSSQNKVLNLYIKLIQLFM